MTRREWVEHYLAHGLHPIPAVARQKFPRVGWAEFQTTAPTLAQWDEWLVRWPDCNIAVVLGRGLFAVDFDGGAAAEDLLIQAGIVLPADAPRSRTANGYHVFLRSDTAVGDRVALLTAPGQTKPAVDIRGKGYVIAPPSIHPTGAAYEWEVPLSAGVPEAPAALVRLITRKDETAAQTAPQAASGPQDGWVAQTLAGVGEGQRDAACTRLAGFLLGKHLDPTTVETLLAQGFARQCVPPFDPRDVRKCVQSIARRERLEVDRAPATVVHIGEALLALEDASVGGGPPVVPTPFAFLNENLDGGFRGGELILLGARPGVGKTALGLEFARAAGKKGISTLIVSREMVNTALARRMLAQEGRIPAKALKRWRFTPDEHDSLASASRRLSQLPIYLTDQAVGLEQIAELVDGFAGLGLVVVDYLQLVRAPAGVKERRHQVEAVSSGLKTLAIQYQVPLICLSSVSRSADNAPPTLASLRESGELEHDADVVIMLHRLDPMGTAVECVIHKNREGALGKATLTFLPEFVSFRELGTVVCA